jgi:hypothetical protein
MGGPPKAPKAPPPAPPPPDPFDQAVRSSRQAARDQELRAKGRKRTLLTSPLGAPGTPGTVGGKTLLGQ